MRSIRLERGPMLVLGHAVLVQAIATAMRPTLSYGVSTSAGHPLCSGAVSAAFALPGIFLALPAGHAMDRLGERSLLVLGPASVVAAALLVTFVGSSIAVLVLATALLGLGHLLCLIGQQAMLGQHDAEREVRLGVWHLHVRGLTGTDARSHAPSPPRGTARTPPLTLIYAACAGLGVVLFGMSMLMRKFCPPPSSVCAGHDGHGISAAPYAGSPPVADRDQHRALLRRHLHRVRAGPRTRSRALDRRDQRDAGGARSGMSMFSRLFLGPMVRAFGRRRLLVWTMGLSAVSLGCVALPLPGIWLVVVSAVYGFVIGSCQPITMSWISDLSPPGSRGLAMSMRLASNRVGQTVLPTTMGSLAAATGAAGVLAGTAVLLVGAAWSSAAVPEARSGDDSSSASTDLD